MQMHRQDLATCSRRHDTANHAEPSQTFIYNQRQALLRTSLPSTLRGASQGLGDERGSAFEPPLTVEAATPSDLLQANRVAGQPPPDVMPPNLEMALRMRRRLGKPAL